jgi:hypothetical protein
MPGSVASVVMKPSYPHSPTSNDCKSGDTEAGVPLSWLYAVMIPCAWPPLIAASNGAA